MSRQKCVQLCRDEDAEDKEKNKHENDFLKCSHFSKFAFCLFHHFMNLQYNHLYSL